jgi:inosose dehydratase
MLLSRRAFSRAAAGLLFGTPAAADNPYRISVEAYIFNQYAERQNKPLADVVSQALAMARNAGFRNIELNTTFFAPDTRSKTVQAITSNHLSMPSVYVGGSMHEHRLAEQTIETALQLGAVCQPFGCRAIVNNPDPKPGGAEKSDQELEVQAQMLNRAGRTLSAHGFQLRVHHHTPQLANNAREWRHILKNTDPKYVTLCMDLDWVHQAGLDPLDLLEQGARRVTEIHVRNSKNKLWLESVQDGDIDYAAIADYLRRENLKPLVVVELAYRPNTVITHPLTEDLKSSRIYTERVFGIHA